MSLDFGLRNVHVLITGAAGGIGLETVHAFQKLGARVTAHYNRNIGELASLQDVVTVQADVRDEKAVNELMSQAAEKNGGPVSVLIVVSIECSRHPRLVLMLRIRIMEYGQRTIRKLYTQDTRRARDELA